ncbi:MAG: 4-hydroxy-tetrahydrodipicolinate reductase [Bacteroidetes bacterium]|uniref:4-hydroxy-tetrahydrodipicolinate reductase n=1 Tax=Phnomibacter sp. TaxID=2836217 RepID=UPI002FDD3F47|nr:4-hydroxy-tetrahydrodipicolinate reductase [Bacteroidota bacterium]
MKVALIGYGKMGKTIEQILKEREHEVVLIIDKENAADLTNANLQKADVAIEFSNPESAVQNMMACFEAGTPVVCGSTGWLARKQEVEAACTSSNGGLIYASNFSLGVNLFFELNRYLAKLMHPHTSYDVSLTEIHHTAKLDAPSGTAISLAEQVLETYTEKKGWVNNTDSNPEALAIESLRIDPAPGTHTITYRSAVDDIAITHTAHNRQGFALGAVLAAEFLAGKKGIYNMRQVLGL